MNTIVLSLLTVTYSTRLPQCASSNSVIASGSFSSSVMNSSNSRCRMPRCRMSAVYYVTWAEVDDHGLTEADEAQGYMPGFP